MFKLFGILILSALFTSILIVPFIDLLYVARFRRKRVKPRGSPVGNSLLSQLHGWKVGTPTGGGILVIISSVLFSTVFYWVTDFALNWTAAILFLTLLLFGCLGLYDDARKMLLRIHRKKIKVLPATTKFFLQLVVASAVGYLVHTQMNLSSLSIPVLGPLFGINPIELGWFYVPFAVLVIVASSNAFNTTDGIDGLSAGLLLISLVAYWYLASLSPFGGDIILFIAVLCGALLPFLYFNIYPSRLYMGDSGAIAFGAILAVVALMTEQVLALTIIGGVFVAEQASSLIQMASMRFRGGRRVFKIAPLHHHFEALGWDETKVTMRFWLAGAVLAFIGLFVATFWVA